MFKVNDKNTNNIIKYRYASFSITHLAEENKTGGKWLVLGHDNKVLQRLKFYSVFILIRHIISMRFLHNPADSFDRNSAKDEIEMGRFYC